jgi:hypothetical protein
MKIIGDSFDRLCDEVIKIRNQPGTAANVAHDFNAHFNARLDGITTQFGNLVASVQQLSNAFRIRIGAVEGQFKVLNENNNL